MKGGLSPVRTFVTSDPLLATMQVLKTGSEVGPIGPICPMVVVTEPTVIWPLPSRHNWTSTALGLPESFVTLDRILATTVTTYDPFWVLAANPLGQAIAIPI